MRNATLLDFMMFFGAALALALLYYLGSLWLGH